jgi:hypothetical protein
LDSSGNRIWGTYFGGAKEEELRSLKLDASNNIFVSGSTASTAGISTPGVYQTTNGGSDDVVFAKFSSDGQMIWASYYGGSKDDEGQGMDVDVFHNVYIAGDTRSTSGISTSNGYKKTLLLSDSDDVFMAKFIDRCYDAHEPNNSKSQAALLTPLQTDSATYIVNTNGTISGTTDKDFYTFSNFAVASNMEIDLTNLPANYDLWLYNSGWQTLGSSKKTGTTNEKIIYNTGTVGTYKLKVAGKSGANNDSVCYTLQVILSAGPLKIAEGEETNFASMNIADPLEVFPNPASNDAEIVLPEFVNNGARIFLFDLMGRAVIDEHLTDPTDAYHLSTVNLANGIYLIEVVDGVNSYKEKIIIQH